MTTGELITEVIDAEINPGDSQSLDVQLRVRAHVALQRLVDKFFNFFRPFAWTLSSGTVVMGTGASAGIGDLPDDFATPGPKLKVYVNGETREVIYKEPGAFFQLRNTETGTATHPSWYTFRGQDAEGDRKIHIHPKNSAALTLLLENYRKVAPTLVDRPDAPTPTATAVGGSPNGAYKYKCTFVTADGETEAGAASVTITVASLQITVTIPVSRASTVTSRKIYRTVAGGSVYKLLATVSDNTTTSYTDNTADGSLGANAPSAATASTGLERIPVQYHRTLLYDGEVMLLKRQGGDGRAEFPAAVMKSFADAWAEENIVHVPRRAPRYGARRRYRV